MEYRFQRLFLRPGKNLNLLVLSLVLLAVNAPLSAQDIDDEEEGFTPGRVTNVSSEADAVQTTDGVKASDLNSEVFELGLFAGIFNIGDFGSEWALGVSAGFQASEDFFLQYNYLRCDAGLSSFEKSQGSYFSGADRKFVHYDLLVGYNLFQGEMYPSEGVANLSSFYLVGGVGDTQFGDEASFTYTVGLGYQIALTRRFILHIDYRNYIYDSALIRGTEETTQNTLFSAGLNYLF